MAALNFAVFVKGVPDFREGKVKFKDDNTLDRGATPTVLNPNDHLALAAAREAQVKHGGTIHVVTMGPPNYKVILKEAFEIAGDFGYLLSDRKMAGADTLATAEALAAGVKKIGIPMDVIFAGFKTADGETGQTGPQAAWKMGVPIITHVERIDIHPKERKLVATRLATEEIEEVESPLPAVVVTDPQFAPDYHTATQRLRFKRLNEQSRAKIGDYESRVTVWDAAALGLPDNMIGLKGSPTIVRMVEPIPVPPKERTAKVLDGSRASDIAELAKILREKGVA
ncbi:MAG: electron transfer flavoprotein subunit beta/FixA family protein [Thermoplasmatota archaeon]